MNKISLISILLSFFISPSFAFNNADVNQILNHTEGLSPKVLKVGLKAYQHARQIGIDQKGILTIIDYSKPSTERRLWVIDLNNDTVPMHTLVAHGIGSGNNYSTHFSNRSRTYASSIGVYRTGHVYNGSHAYSMRLKGLDKGFNDHAYQRSIVMHSAWYVSQAFAKKYGRLGRSWGCPALSQKDYKQVINKIKDGTIVLAYYPDPNWLSHSKFLV